MGTTTSNLGLYKPNPGENGWGTLVNANFDIIDALASVVEASTQSGTSYTLALVDAGTVVETTNGSPVTITVPSNASVAFPINSVVGLFQYGTGQITVAAAGGVALVSSGSRLKTSAQYAAIWLRKRATNEWVVTGDTSS